MSFGVGQFMWKSVQSNLNLKGKRKTIFDRTLLESKPTSYDFGDRKMTKDEFIDFKERLRKSKKRRTIKVVLFTLIFMLCLCKLFVLIDRNIL